MTCFFKNIRLAINELIEMSASLFEPRAREVGADGLASLDILSKRRPLRDLIAEGHTTFWVYDEDGPEIIRVEQNELVSDANFKGYGVVYLGNETQSDLTEYLDLPAVPIFAPEEL